MRVKQKASKHPLFFKTFLGSRGRVKRLGRVRPQPPPPPVRLLSALPPRLTDTCASVRIGTRFTLWRVHRACSLLGGEGKERKKKSGC
jgi:hypothetical protein